MGLHETHESAEQAFLKGILCGAGAHLWWGFIPIYFKLLSHVNVLEVVGHRVVWSLVVTGLFLTWRRAWGRLRVALRSARTRWLLLGSTVAIFSNWIVFLWAIYTERLSQSSLGYYVNPLVAVLMGYVFLGERLRPMQKIALLVAAAGVAYLTFRLGELPWISIVLAFSFAFYGLFRKMAHVEPVGGLFVETALVMPLMLGAMVYIESQNGLSIIYGSTATIIALPFAGIVTATPLVLFSAAARRLPLSTLGFMQYITPTLQLLLAVVFFGEAFTPDHVVAFVTIWSALAIYTWDLVSTHRRKSVAN